ncbi:hypothetical protein YW7DRAFT_02023 [Streptomyces sp. AmelKG-E11A]|nr:hypothetical protein YW7DRAFT_02023 [Streptomyces sp. AmelKG-E11A]
MLTELLTAAKFEPREAVGLCGGDGPRLATVINWLGGRTAPAATASAEAGFRYFVQTLQRKVGGPLHSDDEWAAALRAAQREGAGRGRAGRGLSDRLDPKGHFVRAHLPDLRAQGGLVGRQDERATIRAFVHDPAPGAPTYLCWHAELAVGKTALLADCVKRPPPDVDILNFFVSGTRGTATRKAFTRELGEQIRAFLHRNELSVPNPRDPREWADLLGEAAAKSARRGRKLLLVVDGLDEDAAWADAGHDADGKAGGADGSAGADRSTKTAGAVHEGSIAALLPDRPVSGLRIIVSLRQSTRLPGDLPAGHPLRRRECLRVLGPCERAAEIGRATEVEVDRLRASGLGRTVMGLLAAAGGGLRVVDLAELAEAPFDEVDRLVHGADGRGIVLDDPVAGTYALRTEVLRSVRHELGPTGMGRHTELLHTWAGNWRAVGWPGGTPPYLLTDYLGLLDDPARRAEYVLDARRQVRGVAVAGHDIVLAQIDALGQDFSYGRTTDAGRLGPAARLAASRALLRRAAPQVPPEASALFVGLGDVPRARALARSAVRPVVKAARLARVAVEVSRSGLPGAVPIAEEAARWAADADREFPLPAPDADAYAELAVAAHDLRALDETAGDAARDLLRAVVLSGAADVETLVAAADGLSEDDDQGWVMALETRADDLGMGGPRARAAAVDIWATVARRLPSRRSCAGCRPRTRLATVGDWAGIAHGLPFCRPCALCRITSLCEEPDPSDGLATVDILALAASALAGRPVKARDLLKGALRRLSTALADPDALSPADQAHLGRELSTTLARVARAVIDTGNGRYALDELKELMTTHRDTLRAGLLGDDLAERGEADILSFEQLTAAALAARREEDRENLRAARREKDAERRKLAQQRAGRTAQQPKATGGRRPPRPAKPSPDLPTAPENDRGHDNGPPEHVALLREAGQLVRSGNHLLGRERLEAAIRLTPPVRTAGTTGATGSGWTPALARALGVIGEFAQAELLASAVPGRGDRARHLAALSMGCAQGGHGPEARRYAREAARLSIGAADPALRGQAAQALAHAGEAADAEELAGRKEPGDTMSTGARRAQIRRSLTVVAAGLARRAPGTAARLVGPQVVRLTPEPGFGSPLDPVPQLAELLLAFPDVRRPGSALREAIDGATDLLKKHPQQWSPQALTVLALLEGLKWYPEPPFDAGSALAWCRTLAPDHVPYAELAVLAAVKGDTAEARRLADAAPTAGGRAAALAALATRLAGVPVTLDADRASQDSTVRLCLALAHATGDGSPPDETAARSLVRELLAGEGWSRAIPLLPRLAPEALVPLAELVRAHGPDAAGTG